jgi:hypothetical protein
VPDVPDPDGEPPAEPFVKEFERMWEEIDGLEAMVEAEANMQPIDEYLWVLTRHLRRFLGSTHMRMASNFAADTRTIGEDGREAVQEALELLAAGRRLLIEAAGEDRIIEFERQEVQKTRERLGFTDEGDAPRMSRVLWDFGDGPTAVQAAA